MAIKLEEAQAEIARLNRELATKDRLLKECVQELRNSTNLMENWAYGPAFKKAGVHWPNGKCDAPSFISAKRWIKNYNDNYD